MGLTLVTPATTFPVTLAEAKAHLRVRHTDEDSLISGYIKAATKYVEQTLSMSIAPQTWKLTLDAFSDAIELSRGPVTAVTAVEYYNPAGVEQTVAAGVYTADLTSDRQWLVRNAGESWPSTLDAVNAVSVTYSAGTTEAPDDLRHAILLLIGHWFNAREAAAEKAMTEVPLAVDALVQPYRRVFV